MPELELIATTYFVRETEYHIVYDKWDSNEIVTGSKTYGPYDSRKAAEKKRTKVKKRALEGGWEEASEPYRLLHRRGGEWITDELQISIDERKEKLGGLEKYLKNNQ